MEKKKIFIVEDERIIAMDLAKRLKDMGYEVSGTASSSTETIEQITNHKPDLILMDIVIKGDLDGIETANKLKDLLIPIIYLTAYSDQKTLDRAKLTEPYGYIMKPFKNNEMSSTIEMAIYKNQVETRLKESYKELTKKNNYENIINIITNSIHKIVDIDKIYQNTVNAVVDNIESVDFAIFYVVEGDKAVYKAQVGFSSDYIKRAGVIEKEKGFTWQTISSGKEIYCPDISNDTIIGKAGRDTGTKSYVSLPINYMGITIGCLNVHSKKIRAFDKELIDLFKNVIRQIEVAYMNAQKSKELKENEEKYRSIVEHTSDIVFEATYEGKFLYVSPNCFNIVGFTQQELVGTSLFEYIHPDDLASAIKEFSACLQEMRAGSLTLRSKHKNGKWKLFDIIGQN